MDDNSGRGRAKVAKVKDKTPAPIQITCEQILKDAESTRMERVRSPPRQKYADASELKEYQMRERKSFEDKIRMNRNVMSIWIKYAAWEEKQSNLAHARSIYLRALDIDSRCQTIWLKYVEMEMAAKNVNSARNIFERMVFQFPRVDAFWMKYIHMEMSLQNIAACRQIYERWMEWMPKDSAWQQYINFEIKFKEYDRARIIYKKFVTGNPEIKNWIKYAKFEERLRYISDARAVYERAIEFLTVEHVTEELIVAFAQFEERQKEHERVRVLYKWFLDNSPSENSQNLRRMYMLHEKKYGDPTAVEDALIMKRKAHYEEELANNPFNYDSWFNYIKLMEENDGTPEVLRELYERAISNVPPSAEKRHWRRYIWLWLYYAIYEEFDVEDIEKARKIYKACRDIVPHKRFTFSRVWEMYSKFELRQRNLKEARKIMGHSIGMCPKDKSFKVYIQMELDLKEFDRCRIIFQKFLEHSPENCKTWVDYAEMENSLTDVDRTRALYELGISQPMLDMPEVLWRSYIDFETNMDEFDKVRSLYSRLLEKSPHIKVWLSYALFELSIGSDDCISRSREIYKKADRFMKELNAREERVTMLEKWYEFEEEYGSEESIEEVQKLKPRKELRTRRVPNPTQPWEEYYEYVFPDEELSNAYTLLLAKAKKFARYQNDDDE